MVDVNPIVTCEKAHQICFEHIRNCFLKGWKNGGTKTERLQSRKNAVREAAKSLYENKLLKKTNEVKTLKQGYEKWENPRIWNAIDRVDDLSRRFGVGFSDVDRNKK